MVKKAYEKHNPDFKITFEFIWSHRLDTYLKKILFSSIEQEYDVVVDFLLGLWEHPQHLQHDSTADCIIPSTLITKVYNRIKTTTILTIKWFYIYMCIHILFIKYKTKKIGL